MYKIVVIIIFMFNVHQLIVLLAKELLLTLSYLVHFSYQREPNFSIVFFLVISLLLFFVALTFIFAISTSFVRVFFI